jgi:hypothetical protein
VPVLGVLYATAFRYSTGQQQGLRNELYQLLSHVALMKVVQRAGTFLTVCVCVGGGVVVVVVITKVEPNSKRHFNLCATTEWHTARVPFPSFYATKWTAGEDKKKCCTN